MEFMKSSNQPNVEQENQPVYEIREVTPDDVVAIRTMHAQSWRDTYVNEEHGVTEEYINGITENWLTPEALRQSAEYLSGVRQDPQQFYRVALFDNEAVGYVHAKIKDDGTRYLSGLYTDRSTHGTGLGRQLMELVDEWAQGEVIDLEVASYNERAKAFYRKHGFVEAGVPEGSRYDDIPLIRMIRHAEAKQ